jgi:hypothetical protein
MFRDPLKRWEERTSAQLQLEVPIQTTLPVELRGIRFPSTIEGAKLTTRSEWEESDSAKRCL